MESILLFIIGTVFGAALTGTASFFILKAERKNTQTLLTRKEEETNRLILQMKDSFGSLSMDALSKNTEHFFKMAQESFSKQSENSGKEMDGKKELIDQTLKVMKSELEKVNNMVQGIEKDRRAKFEVLSSEITKAASETRALRETTDSLKSALTNSRVRGQWGERMAEDVLRLAGFIEGTNYLRQSTLKEGDRSRPDYTFYLPDNHIVHMDVKFPLENYLNHINSETDIERDKYKTQFLKDARARVDEVTKRQYVDTSQGTLDYVMVFIPNEQVYAFLNEHDRDLIDNSLKKKIVLCSPTTLYAVLAVIRQAVDNFHMERRASEILTLLESFKGQWGKFTEAMDKVGKRINDSQKAFNELSTTRVNMLEKPLNKIEQLKANERMIETATGTPLKIIDTPDATLPKAASLLEANKEK